MPTNTRTDSYDFKSACEGTITVVYNDMAVIFDGNGYISQIGYALGEKTTYKLHLTNYSLAYCAFSYGYDNMGGIYMYEVVGSGSEYKPKFTIDCNGTILHNDDPYLMAGIGDLPPQVYNDQIWRQKLSEEIDITDLNDWETRFNNAIGGSLKYYYFRMPRLYHELSNVAGRIDITDVTGGGLAIIPYGLYDFYTSNEPMDTPFIDVQTAVYNKSLDYIGSKYNQIDDPSIWYMPHERMSADADGLYCWYYPTTVAMYNLLLNGDYVGGEYNYWQDFSALDGLGLLMQCIYGLNMEQLHLGDKRYHMFRGVQWDVWLDGSGQSMGITMRATPLGQLPKGIDIYYQIGLLSAHNVPQDSGYFSMSTPTKISQNEFVNTNYLNINDEVSDNIIGAGIEMLIIRFFYSPIPQKDNDWIKKSFSNNIPWDGIESENTPENHTEILYGNGIGELNIPPENTDESVAFWHPGAPPNSDDYDDSKEDSDNIDEGEGYNGIGLLTKQYSLTANRAQQLGWQLWEAGFIDNIKLVNNSPMENVISLKALPFNVSGNDEEIVLGNVPMNVNGEKVTSFNGKRLIGSINVTGMYNSFLDFAPFTKITIFLPFIGFKDLDVSAIMYKTLTVYYITDILTGACRAELRVDNVPFVCFDGDIGIDISLAASNRAQVEAAFITSAASNITSAVGSAASGNVEGVAKSVIGLAESAMNQYHTTNNGAPSPACSAYQTRDVYLIYDRPTYQDLKAFNRTHGRMCMLSRTLGTLSGYTVTSPNVDLSGVTATEEEKEEIVKILSSGFFA